MRKERAFAGFSGRLWKSFASIRLTVAILLSLALTSIIGTVIPQNEDPAAYIHEYGEKLYSVYCFFDMFDMYHSWWFRVLLLTLMGNIVVCSIDRLTAKWKIIFVKEPKFNVSRFRNLPGEQNFLIPHPPEDLEENYGQIVSKGFGYSRIEPTKKGFCIFAEKGRWARIGVYIVHLSIILLILGAMLGSILGFDGYVNIPEGEATNHIVLRNSGQTHHLPFEIRCEDFDLSFYDTGAPSEYRSSLSIMQEGKSVIKKEIVVNDPLRYGGINIFQSSYGLLPPREVILDFASRKTGKVYTEKLAIGESFDIPEGLGRFSVKKLLNSYRFHDHDIGECVVGTLIPSKGEAVDIIVPFRYAQFDRMRKGHVAVSVKDFTRSYYTGLQVTSDPGVLVVYAAFIVMIIGIYIAFFMSHQRLCVEVKKDGIRSRVTVAGTSNRDSIGMERKVRRISQRLAKLAQAEQDTGQGDLSADSILS